MPKFDRTILMKTNSMLANEEYLKCDISDENYDEAGELEIDLDYDNNVSEINEPLDLSMKPKTKTVDT